MSTAFFVADGGGFVASEATRGPWHNDLQHAGPPSALLLRQMAALVPAEHTPARFSCEMQRPIAIGPVRCEVTVERAGRKTSLVRGRLVTGPADAPQVCLDARALFVRSANAAAPHIVHAAPVRSLAESAPYSFTFFRAPVGYHTSVELRRASGEWGTGAMAAWMRQRVPLVDGTATSPAERVLVLADAGSGVSAALDPRKFSFVNADLSVHLLRAPRGEWILLDAKTSVDESGRGLASTALFDETGPFGHALQTLVIEPA